VMQKMKVALFKMAAPFLISGFEKG
jgi:hypothetical protein